MRYLVLTMVLLASACRTAQAPAFVVPAPTGPHRVGTRLLDMTMAERPDVFAPPGTRRRFLVQLYYPTSGSGPCQRDIYMDRVTAEAVTREGPLSKDFAAKVQTNSCLGAPMQAGKLPVILFSHGLGASRFGYRALLEELASHGYLVAAIQHTYGSLMTVFPDGKQAAWADAHWATPEDGSRNLEEWVLDAQFVITHLGAAEVGYLGHSYGGSSAVLTAVRDRRVRAVCNLDGRMLDPIAKPVRLDVPFLVLLNESSPRQADYGSGPGSMLARLRGSTHTSFTDTPILDAAFHVPDELAAKLAHPLTPAEALALTRSSVVGFFDCTLRHQPVRCEQVQARLRNAGVVSATDRGNDE